MGISRFTDTFYTHHTEILSHGPNQCSSENGREYFHLLKEKGDRGNKCGGRQSGPFIHVEMGSTGRFYPIMICIEKVWKSEILWAKAWHQKEEANGVGKEL